MDNDFYAFTPGYQMEEYAEDGFNDWASRPVACDVHGPDFYQYYQAVIHTNEELKAAAANVDAMFAGESGVVAATSFPSVSRQLDIATHDVWGSHADLRAAPSSDVATLTSVLFDEPMGSLDAGAREDWSPRAGYVDMETMRDDAMVGFAARGARPQIGLTMPSSMVGSDTSNTSTPSLTSNDVDSDSTHSPWTPQDQHSAIPGGPVDGKYNFEQPQQPLGFGICWSQTRGHFTQAPLELHSPHPTHPTQSVRTGFEELPRPRRPFQVDLNPYL